MTPVADLLANITSSQLVTQLIQKYADRIRIRVEWPMQVEAILPGGRRIGVAMNGGETFLLISASMKQAKFGVPQKGITNVMLRLMPGQAEEFRSIEVSPLLTGGGMSFAFMETDGNSEPQWDNFEGLIELLLTIVPEEDKSKNPKMWREVIEGAMKREESKAVKEQLSSHDSFGTW